MLAEKLRRKRGKREALNPPLLFSSFSAAKACRARGGVREGCWREGWRARSLWCDKVETAKGAPGTTNLLASVLCLLLFSFRTFLLSFSLPLIWVSLGEHA